MSTERVLIHWTKLPGVWQEEFDPEINARAISRFYGELSEIHEFWDKDELRNEAERRADLVQDVLYRACWDKLKSLLPTDVWLDENYDGDGADAFMTTVADEQFEDRRRAVISALYYVLQKDFGDLLFDAEVEVGLTKRLG